MNSVELKTFKCTPNKFTQFAEDLIHGVHNFLYDRLKVALCSESPLDTDETLGDLKEIDYTNLTNRDLVDLSKDTVLSAVGPVEGFRYVVVYNDSALRDSLICWYDLDETITLTDGSTFTIKFSENEIFQIR